MFKIFYLVGAILLFLGTLWMFLPHAYHETLAKNSETSHIKHVLEGLVVTITGLAIMFYSTREQKHPILKFFRIK